MYIKLNFTNNMPFKDIFNIVRIILSNNVNSVNDLINSADFNNSTIIEYSNRILLDTATSEIYRTSPPGLGYNTTVPWTWNWRSLVGSPAVSVSGSTIGTPIYEGQNSLGPELIFERTISTYVPTTSIDKLGKYYIRLKHDGSHLYLGAWSSITGSSPFSTTVPPSSQGSASGQLAATYTYSNGSDNIIGYGMTSATSFFMFINQYSIMIGGKGPSGSKTDSGWIMTQNKSFSGLSTTAAQTSTLTNVSALIADGSKISFTGVGNDTSVNTSSTYYLRTSTTANLYSINAAPTATVNGLYQLHTGQYLSRIASTANVNMVVEGYEPHNVYSNTVNSTASRAHFGPAFVSEYTPYDSTAIVSNGYVPVIYNGGYYSASATGGSAKAWYGMSAQDFFYGDAYHTSQSYKILSILKPTPNSTGIWTTQFNAGVYIGTDQRTLERAPLGDQNLGTATTDRSLSPVLWDQTLYKFPDANGNSTFGLFPLVWSNSSYNTAGGKLTPNLAGFMLFNGDYNPDDYFTYNTTTYALWPMADGFTRRLGIAVPKT